jgi:TldD protein
VLDALVDLMDAAASRCAYADARWVDRSRESASVVDGAIEAIAVSDEEGVGVRVRVDGAWGFAATQDVSRAGLEDVLRRALALAEAQPRRPGAAPLAPVEPARGSWEGPCAVDPFGISLEEKLGLLLAADEAMAGDARIAQRRASTVAERTVKAFASTDGAACEQAFTECGGAIVAVAVEGGELQVRSFPSAHDGDVAQAGWEHVRALDLPGNGARVADEAVALLSAPRCPVGPTTLVLGSEQVALQLHESIGHALELDRMLGSEAAYAGTSWVAPDDVGSLRYGSDALNVVADATLPGGLGTYGWDDEGVPARRFRLVEGGRLVATLSSRETAGATGLEGQGGAMRADGFARQPLVRMTNVSLEPGEGGTLEDLVSGVDEGLYLETNGSWSIDDRRLHFQFATELAREIRGGELGRLRRNPVYAGVTPRFWASLDAVGSAGAWRVHGLLNCGKGEPGQLAHVSHGAAPARFVGVDVRTAG